MPIEALIFDLGGVIVPFDDDAMLRRLAGRCTAPAALEQILAEASDDRYGSGELPVEHLHRRLVDELGYAEGWETFARDFCSHLDIDWRMLELVETLAERHRVLLFSNTTGPHWAHLVAATSGRLARLEPQLSFELGAVKPDPVAFARVIARTRVDPGRTLFVDDRADNVEAGRAAGLQAHQFTGIAALTEHLRAAGVTWPERAELESIR